MSKARKYRNISFLIANKFGIEVRRCCASCAFKSITEEVTLRRCSVRRRKVRPRNWCSGWRMSDQLKEAGQTQGRVKRVEYLKYLATVRGEEKDAEQRGVKVVPKSIEQIRQDFEHEYGEIYQGWS